MSKNDDDNNNNNGVVLETIRIGLEWFINPDHVPFIIGLEKDWFKNVGLDVILVEPIEHLDAIDEIENGQLDIAITEPLHLVDDISKGHTNAVGFARFLHTNGGVMYIPSLSNINRPYDMINKRIQYPGAPGPGGIAIIETMIDTDIERTGTDILNKTIDVVVVDKNTDDGTTTNSTTNNNKYSLIPVNNSFYHTDTLIEKKADVATLIFYNFEVIEARYRGYNDTKFFALKDWNVPDFCQLILISTKTLLQSKEESFIKILRIIQRGIDYIHQYPNESRTIYMNYIKNRNNKVNNNGNSSTTTTTTNTNTEEDDDVTNKAMTNAIFDATIPCFTFDMSMSNEYYESLAKWMYVTKQINNQPKPSDCWTNKLCLLK
jgi:putative hydroxymethylpyrimidine transport system substrate-binding protein